MDIRTYISPGITWEARRTALQQEIMGTHAAAPFPDHC